MLQKILVPLDGSELAEAAIPYVKEISQRCDPIEVTLLQVVRTPSGRAATVFMPMDVDFPAKRSPGSEVDVEMAEHPIYREQEMASERADAEASLKPAARRLREAGIPTRTDVAFGRAAEEIVNYAEEQKFDLIVMCTLGRSGIRRWLVGSVADKVLHGTILPVMLVRPPELRDWPFSEKTGEE
jgi:nucleotide-binding universal stress UspA family protein